MPTQRLGRVQRPPWHGNGAQSAWHGRGLAAAGQSVGRCSRGASMDHDIAARQGFELRKGDRGGVAAH
jgi:hypothetical protein